MITKKANHQFQIISDMVRKLSATEKVSLLNYLMGFLWRDEGLYKGISLWLIWQDKEALKGE